MICSVGGKMFHVCLISISLIILNLQTSYGYNFYRYPLSTGKDIYIMHYQYQLPFEESKNCCQSLGGFLLEIHNEEVQNVIINIGRISTEKFSAAWINLVRTNSNVWVWNDEEPGNFLTYSNWEAYNPSVDGINMSFVNANDCKWMNAYDPIRAAVFCIRGSREEFFSNISTTATTATTSAATTTTATATTTTNELSTRTISTTYTMLDTTNQFINAKTQVGIGVGVGLGGSVLIIVSSLLIAKFVCHKEIPLPFKSCSCIKSSPYETGSDVLHEVYDIAYEIPTHDDQKTISKDLSSENIPPEYDVSISSSNYKSVYPKDQDSDFYLNLRPPTAT